MFWISMAIIVGSLVYGIRTLGKIYKCQCEERETYYDFADDAFEEFDP